jgi:hypothetical protein
MTENKKDKETILSTDPTKAVEEMLKITEELVARIEIETNALATNDGTTFTLNESNKEYVAGFYEKAASEFHARLNQFYGVDKKLINKLNAAQESLKQTTNNNLKLLDKIHAANEKRLDPKTSQEKK